MILEKVRKVKLTRRNRNRKDDLQLQFPVSIVRDMGWKSSDEFVAVLNVDKDMIAIVRTENGGK